MLSWAPPTDARPQAHKQYKPLKIAAVSILPIWSSEREKRPQFASGTSVCLQYLPLLRPEPFHSTPHSWWIIPSIY